MATPILKHDHHQAELLVSGSAYLSTFHMLYVSEAMVSDTAKINPSLMRKLTIPALELGKVSGQLE